jgi:L-alanine-DL-glutamate epimerase-like enolase superfamily enzyme
LKITDVKAYLMSCPLAEPLVLPFWGGERTILKRDAMLIKITTDTGLKGYAPGPAHQRAAQEINGEIRSFLSGKDPRQWGKFNFVSIPETAKTYHAVEIALLDLVGKYENCQVSELIGGKVRNQIKLYGSARMYMPPEKYAEEAAAISEMGFPAYKMRPGIGRDEDLKTVELMRTSAPGLGLMVDAHTWWRMGDRSYTFNQIEQLIKEMTEYKPVWIEEPLPPDDHDAYRKLHNNIAINLASGEHEPDLGGFFDLIDTKAVDYVQMDVLCQGGFEMATQIFKRIKEQDLKFAFHSWGTNLEVLAAAHIGVCWPDEVVEWLEYPCYSDPSKAGMYPFPLANEILKESLNIVDGHLILPDKAGMGIDINENVLEKYPFINGPWSYFRLDSPPQTVAVTGDHSVKWVNGDHDD